MLVSVSLTRRNVIPEDWERGHELKLLPSDSVINVITTT